MFIPIKENQEPKAYEVKGRILTEDGTIADNKSDNDQSNNKTVKYVPKNKKYNITLTDEQISAYLVIENQIKYLIIKRTMNLYFSKPQILMF